MREFDLHQWFSHDELERCPECGESAGIRLPESGSFLCLGCGHVRAANALDAAVEDRSEP
jgi:transcription initiation factor TFIIIB Brf1 subunit/transcription initiation factor TFIIB